MFQRRASRTLGYFLLKKRLGEPGGGSGTRKTTKSSGTWASFHAQSFSPLDFGSGTGPRKRSRGLTGNTKRKRTRTTQPIDWKMEGCLAAVSGGVFLYKDVYTRRGAHVYRADVLAREAPTGHIYGHIPPFFLFMYRRRRTRGWIGLNTGTKRLSLRFRRREDVISGRWAKSAGARWLSWTILSSSPRTKRRRRRHRAPWENGRRFQTMTSTAFCEVTYSTSGSTKGA